jgi:pimeloyl-ACP methyl ester carboxylesterase
MAHATVNELSVAYEVIGEGRPWAITPGGRFSKDFPGVRELAEALAEEGNQILVYDRPNCGASDVCFTGASESAMQADTLAALLRHLDMTPAVISGGSGGARVSMLTAAQHPDVAAGLAVWWISGGAFGLMSLGMHYCGQNLVKAWEDGMEAVAALREWDEVISRNPSNRQKILDQDRHEFVTTMERWMLAYCPCGGEIVPGLTTDDARALDFPTLVFRSGESDAYHTRETSEEIAKTLPNARLVEPPWGDREWIERSAEHQVNGKLFDRWPLLAPQLTGWSREVFA